MLFCISKPNFNQPKPLTEKQIQSQFIEKIARDPNHKTACIILVREGNGPEAPVTNYGLNLSKVDRQKLTSHSILKQRGTLKDGESRQHTFQERAGQSITIGLKSRAFDHNSTLTYIYFHLHSTSLSTHPHSSAFIRNHLRLKNPNHKFSQQPKIPNKKKPKLLTSSGTNQTSAKIETTPFPQPP